jgi:putative ABC transport system ATP-binding protein
MLAITGLSHSFVAQPIFSGFDFSQDSGEHTLLIGPSGSGKTTLINLVAGLLTPDVGTIAIDDEPMGSAKPVARDDLRRRKIGIIFQTLRLVSALSVTANLRLSQRLAGSPTDDAQIAALLDAVGIAHRAHAKPRQLSQGEAQRAAIARALVGKPRLLIADEPTSALDDANAERIGRLLIDTANANGSTLLIATHDMRLKSLIPRAITLTPAIEQAT